LLREFIRDYNKSYCTPSIFPILIWWSKIKSLPKIWKEPLHFQNLVVLDQGSRSNETTHSNVPCRTQCFK